MALLVAVALNALPVPASSASGRAAELLRQAMNSARARGHGEPQVLRWETGQALWFDTPGNPGTAGACVVAGPRFAALVGTAHWRGLSRHALLERWLTREPDPWALPLREVSGSFALLIGDRQRAWIFNDVVGLQKIYTTADGAFNSTSLMACRSTVRQPRLNRLRAQEYVLLGANHGNDTPLDAIRLRDPASATDLVDGREHALHAPEPWRTATPPPTFEHAVARCSELIAHETRSLLSAFGTRVGMALSGGFDSRLLLAALSSHGVAPRLFVYGDAHDDDVRIAQAKARELGLPIDCIDKDSLNAAKAPVDETTLRANLAFFDGLPTDGILDRGADRDTRLLQVANGTLNLNGGGGEVLRNFFYIPDRRYTAADVVSVFYCNWVPDAVPTAADREALRTAIGLNMLSVLGYDAQQRDVHAKYLDRSEVELIYGLLRLRYWMGRNNSVAAAHGEFMTPLAQPALMTLAAHVPLAWKTFGQLESAVIRRLSPRVAAGPSSYGFSFADGPGVGHRLRMLGTLLRPVALRGVSTALRFRLGGRAPPVPDEWEAAHALPPVDWLRTDCLTDLAQANRLRTLCAFLDDKLALPPADSGTVISAPIANLPQQ